MDTIEQFVARKTLGIRRFALLASEHFMKAEGWLELDEAAALFLLAESLSGPDPVIVEVGSHLGKSTGVMAHALRHGLVYAVDPWDARGTIGGKEVVYGTGSRLEKFLSNVAGLPVVPLQGTSAEIAPNFPHEIDLLFIDGDHREQGVINDLDLWTPKLKVGGMLAMHDFYTAETAADPQYERGPFQAVQARISSNPTWGQQASLVHSLFITRKES